MAPKAKKAVPQKASPPPEPRTVAEARQAQYLASSPLEAIFEKKGWNGLSAAEQNAYANSKLLESGSYKTWTQGQQKDFLKLCEQLKITLPLPKPKPLGKDIHGKSLGDYTTEEYAAWNASQQDLRLLKLQSSIFRRKAEHIRTRESQPILETFARQGGEAESELSTQEDSSLEELQISEEEVQQEKQRRIRIVAMESGNQPGRYEGDPDWDDVIPIPQDEGENPLAAIAYTDEYSEAISYLRAIIAAQEHSSRVLSLTEHVISMNPGHYTVWRYRASTLFALNSDITTELQWLNDIALRNEKNFQIWHHRQLLLDHVYEGIAGDSEKVLELARAEVNFLSQMFDLDSKNYHVWSYRQYLVRKLGLFPSQCSDPNELRSIEYLIRQDVRNNSAWSHRFFLVFSDPAHTTEGIKAVEYDDKVPDSIIEREVLFAEKAIWIAPQNQSPWNYLRGVLKKGGRGLETVELFALEFVKLGEGEDASGEDIKSSHALDLLADIWTTKKEHAKADIALSLLGDKYDPIRKNYWEWRRNALQEV